MYFFCAGESGGRADVRWVLLKNPETDKGLQIMYGASSTPAGGQMSATPFSMEALESTPHDYQLQVGVNSQLDRRL